MNSAEGIVPRSRQKFLLVEVARGLAALAVVFFHSNASADEYGGPYFQWMATLEHGVDFFFVLSGFIILTAHRQDIGNRTAVADYLKKRAIRLLPLLWLVVAGYTALRYFGGGAVYAEQIFRSLFPYPSLQPASPMVVWTLRHEIVFYLLFVALIYSRTLGLWIFALWTGAALVQLVLSLFGLAIGGIWSFWLSSYTLDFALGMGIAYLHGRRQFGQSALPLLAGILLLVGSLLTMEYAGFGRLGETDYVSPAATVGTLFLGLIFAIILHGLLRLEGRFTAPSYLVSLGSASYAIYLVHTPLNSILQRLVTYLPDQAIALGGGHIFLIVFGVVGGFVIYFTYERPVGIYLKTKLVKKKLATE